MSSNFTVIYDACVLYPAPLRDLLMRLALTDLYRARWTDMIHDEWIRNVLLQRPDLKREDLERTRSLMNANVRDSLVTGFAHLIPAIELPDADDRHVVAAAIHAGANLIVTFNLKDFPAEALKRSSATTSSRNTLTTSSSTCLICIQPESARQSQIIAVLSRTHRRRPTNISTRCASRV